MFILGLLAEIIRRCWFLMINGCYWSFPPWIFFPVSCITGCEIHLWPDVESRVVKPLTNPSSYLSSFFLVFFLFKKNSSQLISPQICTYLNPNWNLHPLFSCCPYLSRPESGPKHPPFDVIWSSFSSQNNPKPLS